MNQPKNIKMTPAHRTCAGRRFLRDERGLSSVEYVILMVVVVVGAMEAWKSIGTEVSEGLGNAKADFETLND